MCRWQDIKRPSQVWEKQWPIQQEDGVHTKTWQLHLYQSNTTTRSKNTEGLGSLLQLPDLRKDWDAQGIHGRQQSGNLGWRECPSSYTEHDRNYIPALGETLSFMDVISRKGTGLSIKNLKPWEKQTAQAYLKNVWSWIKIWTAGLSFLLQELWHTERQSLLCIFSAASFQISTYLIISIKQKILIT